jgi:hypothetical protein
MNNLIDLCCRFLKLFPSIFAYKNLIPLRRVPRALSRERELTNISVLFTFCVFLVGK